MNADERTNAVWKPGDAAADGFVDAGGARRADTPADGPSARAISASVACGDRRAGEERVALFLLSGCEDLVGEILVQLFERDVVERVEERREPPSAAKRASSRTAIGQPCEISGDALDRRRAEREIREDAAQFERREAEVLARSVTISCGAAKRLRCMRRLSREHTTIVRWSGRVASKRAKSSRAPGELPMCSAFSKTNVAAGTSARQAAIASSMRSLAEDPAEPSSISRCVNIASRSGASSASAGSKRRARSSSSATPAQSQIANRSLLCTYCRASVDLPKPAGAMSARRLGAALLSRARRSTLRIVVARSPVRGILACWA